MLNEVHKSKGKFILENETPANASSIALRVYFSYSYGTCHRERGEALRWHVSLIASISNSINISIIKNITYAHPCQHHSCHKSSPLSSSYIIFKSYYILIIIVQLRHNGKVVQVVHGVQCGDLISFLKSQKEK